MLRVKDITLMAILTTILFVQEQAFTFLPNIQLTVMLLVLYTKTLGMKKTMIIVVIHTILDNLIMGSFHLLFVGLMLLGWLLIPLLLGTVFKRVENVIALAFLGILFSFLFCWVMLPGGIFIQNARFIDYFLVDLPWQILLAISSFFTILWLYEPLKNVMHQLDSRLFPE